MTLNDVVSNIESLDPDLTIYAAEPWSRNSDSIVDFEPPNGGLPNSATEKKLSYFLEVYIAQQFINDWERGLEESPSITDYCDRLIRYAIDDA